MNVGQIIIRIDNITGREKEILIDSEATLQYLLSLEESGYFSLKKKPTAERRGIVCEWCDW